MAVHAVSKNFLSNTHAMKITTKGQVTIPQPLRMKFGLLPNTEVAFEEADGCVLIRPILGKRALIEERSAERGASRMEVRAPTT